MATIYKILSPDLLECYVGSTKNTIEWRFAQHKRKENTTTATILFDKYGYDTCKIVEMEVCPIEERRAKEQWWLDHSVGAVNQYAVIGGDVKVYHKAYYEANREKWEKQKNDYTNNTEYREKRIAQANAYYLANREKRMVQMKARYKARCDAKREAKKSE